MANKRKSNGTTDGSSVSKSQRNRNRKRLRNDNTVTKNIVVRTDNVIQVDNGRINSSVIDTNLIVNERDDLDLLDISDNNVSVMTSEQVFWYDKCRCNFNFYLLR
jgi:hypothetical protein